MTSIFDIQSIQKDIKKVLNENKISNPSIHKELLSTTTLYYPLYLNDNVEQGMKIRYIKHNKLSKPYFVLHCCASHIVVSSVLKQDPSFNTISKTLVKPKKQWKITRIYPIFVEYPKTQQRFLYIINKLEE